MRKDINEEEGQILPVDADLEWEEKLNAMIKARQDRKEARDDLRRVLDQRRQAGLKLRHALKARRAF